MECRLEAENCTLGFHVLLMCHLISHQKCFSIFSPTSTHGVSVGNNEGNQARSDLLGYHHRIHCG